ncbi:MAG: hypothetical protein BRD28_01340 [Bacteroidetes bacterium QH_10_64_37]|jgi:hypothetical protein|nr:MAG: hypothetical protein BRD28_01340 [Bacteroidetes bacterium QH_10_64_37]
MRFPALSTSAHRLALLIGGLLVLALGTGCQSNDPPSSYVARVGSHYLTQDDLSRMLADMGPARDSAAARQQVIDQWVTRTLLYREAERLNLQSVDSVQQQLERQRRSVLVSALKTRLYRETDRTPSSSEVRTYFERHKEQLSLREPYVRVRYLSTARRAAAQTARQTLRTLPPQSDSTWRGLVRTHAADTTQAYRLSQRFLPVSRLTRQLPFLEEVLGRLEEGDAAPVLDANGRYHVLRLDRRLPEGADPKLKWIEPEIRRRLRIRARKQMYAHEVQRLRSQAQADGAIETP